MWGNRYFFGKRASFSSLMIGLLQLAAASIPAGYVAWVAIKNH